MTAQMLKVSLLGVGTVLRLERDGWSMVKRLRQATNEYAPRVLRGTYVRSTFDAICVVADQRVLAYQKQQLSITLLQKKSRESLQPSKVWGSGLKRSSAGYQ